MSSTQGITRDATTGHYKMQDMTASICNLVEDTENTTILTDTRDGTNYHVGKLGDDRCWLLDNLALDLTNTNVKNAIYDSSDSTHNTMTNATNEQIGYLFNGGRDSDDSSTNNLPTAGVSSNWTSSNSYSDPLINVSNKDVLPTTYNNTDEPLASTVTSENWKVGVYYNYCAASAGSYCYGSGTSQGSSVDKANTAIDAEYDICPSGWRMPTGSSYDATARPDGGEYLALYNGYPSISGGDTQYTRVRKVLRLPLSGYFRNGLARNQGSYGYFWSSTCNNSYYMYRPLVSTSDINPQDIDLRHYGLSVRCIAK